MASYSNSPQSLAPHLIVGDARAAIDFYVAAFGATEHYRLVDPADDRIGHAELSFGASRLYLCDPYPDFGAITPEALGGSPVQFHLNVDDADAFVARAVAAGAVVLRSVQEQFHGHRTGLLADPFGYKWFVDAAVEQVSADEAQRRWSASTGV